MPRERYPTLNWMAFLSVSLKYFKPISETKTLSLSPGDTMIFYSDGLGEIDRKRPNVLSTEHIMEYLRGMKGYSAQEVCQACPMPIIHYW